jgi:hypothetical protein
MLRHVVIPLPETSVLGKTMTPQPPIQRTFFHEAKQYRADFLAMIFASLAFGSLFINWFAGLTVSKDPKRDQAMAWISIPFVAALVSGAILSKKKIQRCKRPEIELFCEGILFRPVDRPNFPCPWYVPRYGTIVAEAIIGQGIPDRTYFAPWKEITEIKTVTRFKLDRFVAQLTTQIDPIEADSLTKPVPIERIEIHEMEMVTKPEQLVPVVLSFLAKADQNGHVTDLPSIRDSDSIPNLHDIA